jgi:CysZ protein
MLGDFFRALGQLGDRRFRSVLWRGIGLTLALLVAVYVLVLNAIRVFVPDQVTLPWIGPVGGIDAVLSWGSIPVILLASVFLMVPVASAFTGFFLEDVAEAVEDRHYPALPALTPVPFLTTVLDSMVFFGVLVLANLLALTIYPFAGPLAPVVFWAVNGYLLGREYFTMVAMRRVGRAGARMLRRRHAGEIWLAGTLMAAPLSVPLVNLLIPVLGIATFTHLFHRLQARGPSPR